MVTGRGSGSPTVVGGDRQVAALADDLGAGVSAVLVGRLGTGKSFLLDVLLAELRRRGTQPLVVRGAAPLTALVYGALSDEARRRLAQAGADTPLTVLVDDAQDLDEHSLRLLLRRMAEGAARVAFAVTTGASRMSEPAQQSLRTLLLQDHVRRHDLRGLTTQEAEELLEEFPGGAELDRVTRFLVVDSSRGSRLLLRQLTAEAVDALRAGAEPFEALLSVTTSSGLHDALAVEQAVLGEPARMALVALDRLRGIPYVDGCAVMGAEAVAELITHRFVLADGARWRRLYGRRMAARQVERELGPVAVEAHLDGLERRVLADAAAGVVPHGTLCAFVVARRRVGGPLDHEWAALDSAVATRIAAGAAREANRSRRPELALACAQLPGVARHDPELAMESAVAAHAMGDHVRAFADLEHLDTSGLAARAVNRYVELWIDLVRWAPDGQRLEDVLPRVPAAARGAVEARIELVRAERAMVALDWGAALASARRAREATTSRQVAARAGATGAAACAFLDRTAESDAMFAAARRLLWEPAAGRSVGLTTHLWSVCLEAFARTATGRPTADLLEEVERGMLPAIARHDPGGLAIVNAVWALVLAGRGEVEGATRELGAALRRARRVTYTPWRPLLASALALGLASAGRPSDARRALVESEDVAPGARPMFDAARLAAEAAVAAAEGDPAAAVTALQAARNAAGHASPLVDRILERRLAEVAATEGAGPAGAAGPVSERRDALLSEREVEIALLVAQGLPNREIANALVVSVRTVESHIYQASHKLGVASRRELGRVVSSGWVSPPSRAPWSAGTPPR